MLHSCKIPNDPETLQRRREFCISSRFAPIIGGGANVKVRQAPNLDQTLKKCFVFVAFTYKDERVSEPLLRGGHVT